MTKDELLKAISSTLYKVKVQELAVLGGKRTFSIEDLIDLSFYPRKEVAFRAALILEHITVKYPEQFLPWLEVFLNRYSAQKNRSCQRHYTKIVMHLTDRKASEYYQLKMPNFDLECIIETTFEWLIDKKTPIAVQVNSMEILFNLKGRYDWVKDELKAEIEFLLKEGGPAIQSRGKKILKMLNKN